MNIRSSRAGISPRLPGALLLLGLLLPATQLVAGIPTPYGEYFVRLGAQWPDAGAITVDPGAAAPAVDTDAASYLRQLRELEQEGGPYADSLAEPLAGLARLQRASGDIVNAQQAYQRALHVVRINDGLYSERQVPILKALFEVYRMTGDLATLDARYDYYFRLYGSGLPPYTPVRLTATLEYLRWQREALRLGLDERDTERLLALYALNERVLADVSADSSVDFAGYRELVLSQLRNLYLVDARYEPRIDDFGPGPEAGLPAEWDQQDTHRQRLEAYQRRALSSGRELLEALILRTPADDRQGRAAAYLELADWNQWNDRRSEALAAYGQVVTILQEAGEGALLQQWLGQPVELPANGAFWQPRPMSGETKQLVVRARYDVTRTGRANNIEATAAVSENGSAAARVRRKLAQTRFRPCMASGEPQAQMQVQRDYEVLR